MTPEDLAAALAGDDERVEWKQSARDGDEILRAVCALANDLGDTGRQGFVIVGLDKHGHGVGADASDAALTKLSDRLRSTKILPHPSCGIERVSHQGKTLVVIAVASYSVPPVVKVDGAAWVRVGPSTHRASEADLARLQERRPEARLPFDLRGVPGARVDDLEIEALRLEYGASIGLATAREEFPQLEPWLRQRDVVRRRDGGWEPTGAGLLVYGVDPQGYVPGAIVEFTRYAGSRIEAPVISRKTIAGRLPDQLEGTWTQLQANLVSVAAPADGVRSPYVPEYPLEALKELARNLVQHRSYEGTHAPSRVTWFDDRIEMTNPGGPFGQANEGEFGEHSDYRNLHGDSAPRRSRICRAPWARCPACSRIACGERQSPAGGRNRRVYHRGRTEAHVRSLALFNNKGGAAKTMLNFNIGHMMARSGLRVVLLDYDPQCNLSAIALAEENLEAAWEGPAEAGTTVARCIDEVRRGKGDIAEPKLVEVADDLWLLPGDLALSRFEQTMAENWLQIHQKDSAKALHVTQALERVAERSATGVDGDVVIVDIGPNLGALNRAALLAADVVVMLVTPDLFGLQGLKNAGPSMQQWRDEWDRIIARSKPELAAHRFEPKGYIVEQYVARSDRPGQAYGQWATQIPSIFHELVLGAPEQDRPRNVEDDPFCIAMLKHFASLVPFAQQARKPIFDLKIADGIGSGQIQAVARATRELEELVQKLRSMLAL